MTIVIGIHSSDFVLIGADTRSMQVNDAGTDYIIDDTVEKVFESGIGVFSGAGHWALIQLARLRMRDATSQVDVRAALEAELANLRGLRPAQEVDDARRLTAVMYSYIAKDGAVVLATAGAEDDYAEHRVGPFEHAMLSPAGLPDDVEAQIRRQMQAAIDRDLRDLARPLATRAEMATQIVEQTVHFIGARLRSISERAYQIGILHRRGLIQVSEIIDDVKSIRLRDAVRPFGF